VAGQAEHLLLDTMLERFKERGLVKARGKQRTDSTHVLAAVHELHLLELVAETLRATLDDLATIVPDWVRAIAQPAWFERYGHRIEDYRLPKSQEKRQALALEIGADGFRLLDALDAPTAPVETGKVPMVQTLRDVWRVHYAGDDGQPRWRAGTELPPLGERLPSPYDPEMHYSTKRQIEWSGYKVHVTETCDDDAAHVITHVKTCPAMQQDMTSTAEIHARLAAKELLPAEHFVDSAYVSTQLCWSAASGTMASRCKGRCAASRPGRAAWDRGMICPTSPSTGTANRSPARKAKPQSLGGLRAATTEVRASTLGLAAQIAVLARSGHSARRRKMHAAPSTSIRARNTKR
jgi:transposase